MRGDPFSPEEDLHRGRSDPDLHLFSSQDVKPSRNSSGPGCGSPDGAGLSATRRSHRKREAKGEDGAFPPPGAEPVIVRSGAGPGRCIARPPSACIPAAPTANGISGRSGLAGAISKTIRIRFRSDFYPWVSGAGWHGHRVVVGTEAGIVRVQVRISFSSLCDRRGQVVRHAHLGNASKVPVGRLDRPKEIRLLLDQAHTHLPTGTG